MLQSFLPKKNELAEISIRFHESARAMGVPITVRPVIDYKAPELGYHPDIEYSEDSFDTYMILDEAPSQKLLKQLGWAVDDDEDTTKPMMFYITRFYPTDEDSPHEVNTKTKELLLNKYSIITVDYDYDDKGKDFIVTRIAAQSFNPVYYIGLLVPYRKPRDRDRDPSLDGNVTELDAKEFDGNLQYLSKEKGRDRYRDKGKY